MQVLHHDRARRALELLGRTAIVMLHPVRRDSVFDSVGGRSVGHVGKTAQQCVEARVQVR